MKGEELTVVETLKMRALPEGSCEHLLEFLRMYRDAVQLVVNELWSLDGKLSKKKLHEAFYEKLRKIGFRAHHVKEIYVYAKSIVESAKSNGGERPVLRKITARIDKYDYKLDLNNRVLTLKLHNGYEVKLRLITSKERVMKYKNWGNYEIVVKYDGENFSTSIYFKKTVKPVKPKTIMAIDLNFDNLTLAIFTLNDRLVRLKRFRTSLRKILIHRIWIERIQKRYPRSWRNVKGIRKAIEKHGERIVGISWDYAHKIGDLIADLAFKYNSIIILEDLEKLRENAKKGRRFNKKLTLWFYRRVQFCVEYEAKERGLRIIRLNPRGTSSTCPRCSSKLVGNGRRTLKCNTCNFIGDRDVVATINLYKKLTSKYSRCGEPGVSPNAPEQMQSQVVMRGNRDEAMKNHIKLYKLI